MKIALVHDDFIQWGGAERVAAVLAEAFPDAPIYTIATSEEVVQKSGISPDRFKTTFIDKLPGKSVLNKALFPLYPMLFESFDFSAYDVVLSTSARFAHSVVTKPTTTHISYIHSPFRGFWMPSVYFGESLKGKFLKNLFAPLFVRMRGWDYVAAQRADYVISNSHTIQRRVAKYWKRESIVMYPFVDIDRFATEKKPPFDVPEEFYIAVTRLAQWKRIDLVVEAANKLKFPTIIVGTGEEYEHIKSLAQPHVKVVGYLSDEEVSYLIRRSKALIHPQQEDFGMTVIEAHACGTPVIAYGVGGATETVVENKTGIFFDTQSVDSLADAMKRFEGMSFDNQWIKEYAQRFSKDSFTARWKEYVSAAYSGNAPKTMD